MPRRVAVAWAIALAVAASARAQSGTSGTSTGQNTAGTQTPSSSTATTDETRPATTTFFGDTGLWFVPTGEVLANGKWSVSGYRRGTKFIQGYSNISDFAGTFGIGIRDRAEVFGSFLVDTRIDRDVRPVFVNDPSFGGIIDRYPRVTQYWTGDNVGDLYLGAKINLLSQFRQDPAAVALRGIVKVPTGKSEVGVSTGKADVAFDAIVSKEAARLVEVAGYGGYEWRGRPDGVDAPAGAFHWGAGVTFPSRNFLRVVGELNGNVLSSSTATLTGSRLVGIDGSLAPLVSNTQNSTRATVGLTVQAKNGFFFGGGFSWNVPTKGRNLALSEDHDDMLFDYYDWQFRIGYHPGVRVYVPPPPPRQETPPATQPVQNRPPTVRARCEPCIVEVGRTSTVTADAQDPDGDTLTYRWSAPAGTFQNAADRQTIWTAPQQEGPVPVTVTVNDGRGGTASDSVTIQVIRRPIVQLDFEDVYFDFDRSTLRPAALRLLDDAVTKLQANPERSIVIEGHTCNIGTAEYNLALGNRRAASVRDYLLSRGIAASRMETRSYGEERPKYDNSREETRRLNRRAALVVRVQ